MDNYTLHSKMWIEKSFENNTGYLYKHRIFLQREFKLIVVSACKKNCDANSGFDLFLVIKIGIAILQEVILQI